MIGQHDTRISDILTQPDLHISGLRWHIDYTATLRTGDFWRLHVGVYPLWGDIELKYWIKYLPTSDDTQITIKEGNRWLSPSQATPEQVQEAVTHHIMTIAVPAVIDLLRATLLGEQGQQVQAEFDRDAMQFRALRTQLHNATTAPAA